MRILMSLINNKYNYQPIHRKQIEGKRKYLTPDGNAVASVTTILDATKDKTHLIAWRKRVGETKAQEIVTEAAGVGTRMHKYLEDYVEFGEWPTPGSNPFAIKAHCMAEVIRDKAMVDVDEIWGSEVQLYVPQLYAGTTDLVGQYKGNPCIMDFKQTNKPKKPEWVIDYYLQMVAYAEAHTAVYGTEIREGHVFMCSRGDDGMILGGETYQQFDLWPHEYDEWKHEWYERVYKYYETLA
jgi:ATP-dependent exoDNAse (exonuclease V) beta subunit